jgi:hypothetical protein
MKSPKLEQLDFLRNVILIKALPDQNQHKGQASYNKANTIGSRVTSHRKIAR